MAVPELAWAYLGLGTAVLAALMMLMQEKMKVEGFALAFWCKIACVITTLPFVIYYGLPSDPRFYLWLVPQSFLFAVSDVVMFRSLPKVGAGVVSRLLPSTVVIGFFLWFAVAPEEIKLYVDRPVIGSLIVVVLCGAAFFAMRLRKCVVSMQALRMLWFVLAANAVSPLMAKITTRYATVAQGAFGFTFAEALMMIAMWVVWLAVARPVSFSSLVEKRTWQRSLPIGIVTAVLVIIFVTSYYYIDNPGYVSAVQLVYAPIIMAAHKWMGKKDDSDVFAGLGIVACAMALIVLKTQLG
ncbi:MAG: hypothetical protein EPN97_18340 [Alphaproteobacteria bacterium]|nr:MAG: hypothetical protein EPN97_18340 [Alphaproteobacteria bacterium]